MKNVDVGIFRCVALPERAVVPAGVVVEPGDRPEVFVALDDVGRGLDSLAGFLGKGGGAPREPGSDPANAREASPVSGVRGSGWDDAISKLTFLAAWARGSRMDNPLAPASSPAAPGTASGSSLPSTGILPLFGIGIQRAPSWSTVAAGDLRSGDSAGSGDPCPIAAADIAGPPDACPAAPDDTAWSGDVCSAATAGGAAPADPWPPAPAERAAASRVPGDSLRAAPTGAGDGFSSPPDCAKLCVEPRMAAPATGLAGDGPSARDDRIPRLSPESAPAPARAVEDWPECESGSVPKPGTAVALAGGRSTGFGSTAG